MPQDMKEYYIEEIRLARIALGQDMSDWKKQERGYKLWSEKSLSDVARTLQQQAGK